jgi:hypothetical protein
VSNPAAPPSGISTRQPNKEQAMKDSDVKDAAKPGVKGALVGGAAGAVAGGAIAGAAAGGLAGPVGAAIGAVAGAIGAGAGGVLAGNVEAAEDLYWRDNYAQRPYVTGGATYDDYGPAYRYGVAAHGRYQGRDFDEFEHELSRDWGSARERSTLDWERARPATRDAWQRMSDRVERVIPGDSDRDGR